MIFTPAFAQDAGGDGGGSFLASMLPLVLIFVIFYFLLIRPQQKRSRQHKEMLGQLRRGDQVVTAGGILAKVTKVMEGDEVEVELAKGVKVKMVKSTITMVLSRTEPVRDEPARDEPAPDEPAKRAPAKRAPARRTPAKRGPAKGKSTEDES